SVVAALAGDWQAAHDVQLELPETGVCNSNPTDSATADNRGGPTTQPTGKGLTTGINGGLLATPLNLVSTDTPASDRTGGCCGS
ncbi:flavoprotein, partial [Micromonospora sp. C95]|nr:flavoprotein [Micromonospora sp. C95]